MASKHLMVVFVSILLQGYVSSQSCFGNDTGITLYCSSCSSAYLCTDSSDPVTSFDCETGEGCSVSDDDCISTSTLDFGNCGCSDGATSFTEGSYADPYDNTRYVTCDANGDPTYSECENGYFDDEEEACVELPECPTGFTGEYPVEDSCTKFLNCTLTGGSSLEECSADLVFDFNSQACVDLFACDGTGEFSDSLKCNIFHSCYDSASITHCCPFGQNYDESSSSCVIASESSCERAFLNTCIEEDYENMYCNYCQTMNEGDTYSTYLGSECQTNYYQCVASGNDLVATLMKCDDGEVYAADTGKCEFIESHPNCEDKQYYI